MCGIHVGSDFYIPRRFTRDPFIIGYNLLYMAATNLFS